MLSVRPDDLYILRPVTCILIDHAESSLRQSSEYSVNIPSYLSISNSCLIHNQIKSHLHIFSPYADNRLQLGILIKILRQVVSSLNVSLYRWRECPFIFYTVQQEQHVLYVWFLSCSVKTSFRDSHFWRIFTCYLQLHHWNTLLV
jgi:hypothetical protein